MLKYIVDEEYYPMEFPEGEKNTAFSIAEVLANKGRDITIRVTRKTEPDTEKREICYCPDCSNYYAYVNCAGRLVQMCEAHGIEVSGDFYCAEGELNRKGE